MKSTINIEDIVLSPSLILPPTFPEYIDFKKTKDDVKCITVINAILKLTFFSYLLILFKHNQ